MLLNSDSVEKLIETNGMGKKTQVGYDLTVKTIKKVGASGGIIAKKGTTISEYTDVEIKGNGWVLDSGVYSITFHQGCKKIPNNLTATIWPRSSVLRCGSLLKSGLYDPGFEVKEMGAMLFVFNKIYIKKNVRLAQIIFMENEPVRYLYNGQWKW